MSTMDALNLFGDIGRQSPTRSRAARRNAARRRQANTTAQWPLDDSITVVLFAGLGGACQGLEEAGLPVHVAVNHDEVAIAAHKALNPHTKHIRGDIFDVDPMQATGGRRVKVLWASPDCRDHSVAKGGAPRSPRVRSLPWQVCRWAGKTKPKVIGIENVREIRGWGPLVAKRDKATGRVLKVDGTVAARGERVPVQEQQLVRDKKRLGRSFRRFTAHLRGLGYAYEDRDLNCADYGVPTSRRRYFAVARCDGQPIAWPERTHAPRDEAEALGLLPWVPAADIIDWSLPLPSIFERKKPLADATMKRIATGLKRFVLDNPTPFIIPLTHHGEGRVYPVGETLRTITSAHRGELALVSPMTVPVCHSKDGSRIHDGAAPVPTMTTAKGGEFAVAGVHLTKFNENSTGQEPSEPIHTLMAGAPRFGVVGAALSPHITKFRAGAVGVETTEPLPTVTANGHSSRPGCAIPLGIVGAFLNRYHGEKRDGEVRGVDLTGPIATQTTENRFGLVGAWMAQHNTGVIGHGADDALSTLTTTGSHQQLAAAYLAELRGTADAKDVTGSLPTQTAGGFHTAAVAAFLTKYYGAEADGQDCRDALHTLSTRDRFGVVTVNLGGQPYAVVDIGMRMLEPHEAAAAHELELPAQITINGKTRPLTKTEAMRLVGNSVPKRMARLLAEVNAAHTLYAVPAVAAE